MPPPPPTTTTTTTTTPRHPAPQAVDAVDPTDDESIDSDDAFNSDDERLYGSFFPGGPAKTKKRRRRSSHDDDDDGDGSEDSDGESDEVEEEESDDSDDDSSDDGLAGSDDSDDDDAEGDGGQYMLDLLDRLDDGKKSSTSSSAHDGGLKAAAAAAAVLPESEFAAPPSAGGGTGGKGELTLDSLLTPLATTRKFASVQATLRDVSGADDHRLLPRGPTTKKKKLETTQAPAPKVVSDRASRKVHYAAATDDAKLWTEAVKANREAETLDFRPKGRLRVTRDELVGKFEPTTDFEREIVDALDAAQGGTQDEHTLAQRERDALLNHPDDDDDDDDLGVHQLTVAELKKRHGQLAKLRALLFYHEQKRHRINKIKSKKYRKIRKRQRDRRKENETTAALQEGGAEADELARELQEKEEMERMKERMTLAHKNTSKWARRVLRRGGNVDVETRRALSLQIARGDELRKKMMGDDDDDDDGSGDDDDGDEADLIEQARKVLQETEKEEDGGGGGAGKEKGLFQLSFMKRGIEAQRARAKEEARRLLRELESNEAANASDDDDDDEGGNRKDSDAANGEMAVEGKGKSKKQKTASAAEVDQVLPSGKYVASSLRFGKSDGFSVAVGGGIDVELGDADANADAAGTMGGGGDASSAAAAAAASDSGGKNDVPTEQAAQNGKKKRKNRRKKGKKAADGGNDKGAPSGGSSGGGDHTADVTLSAIDASSSAGADASEEKEKTRATTASVAGAGSKRPRTEEEGDKDEPESNPWIARADDGKEEDDGAGPTNGNSVKKRKKANKQRKATTAGVTRDGIVDAGGAADLLDGGGGAVGEDDGVVRKNGRVVGKERGDGAASGIAGLSQEQLVRRAFAAPDAAEVEEEFEKEKEAMLGRDDPTRKKVEEKVVSGWGSWAGEGAPPPRRKSRKLPKHLQPPEKKAPEGRKRKDDGLKRVIINEKRVKKTANKFQLANIPYPYSSREQYERAMSGALGQEWNVTSGVKEMTRPEIIVRSGKIIQPLSIKAKAKPKRAPAKF